MALEEAWAALKRPIALLERETQLRLQHESDAHIRALHDERSCAISVHTGRARSDTGDQQLSESVAEAYESMQLEMTAAKSELVHLSQKMLLQLESTRDQTKAMSLGVGLLEHHVTRQTLTIEELAQWRQEEAAAATSRCNQLEMYIEKQGAQCQSYKQDLERLRTQLAGMEAQHAHDMKQLAKTGQAIDSERHQHEMTKDHLRELESAVAKYRTGKTQAQLRLQELGITAEQDQREKLQMQHQLRELESATDKYRSEITDAGADIVALRVQQQAALCELEEHREQASNMKRECAQLQEIHCDELASVKKQHEQHLSAQSAELARVQEELSVQLQRYQAEIQTMKMEHEAQLQRHKKSTGEIEARVLLVQSALEQETERTVELKVRLAQAEAARDIAEAGLKMQTARAEATRETAEAELKMQMARAEAARQTAKAEHDSSLEVQRDINASSQDVQLLRIRVNDLHDCSSDLAAENGQLKTQVVGLQEQLQRQLVDGSRLIKHVLPVHHAVTSINAEHSNLTAPPNAISTTSTGLDVASDSGQWLADFRDEIDRDARQKHLGVPVPPLLQASLHRLDLNHLV